MIKSIPANASMSTIQSIFKNYRDIVFTKSIYKFTSTIKIYSNTRINFNGATIRRHHSGPLFRLYDSSSTTKYNGTHDVELYNGTLEGMNKLGLSANTLLTMFHGLNIKVHDIKFLDIPGCHAIDCVACKNVSITNCKFNGYASVGNDFREVIQLDFAYHNGLPTFANKSKCYDMTHCDSLTIENCNFDKSNSYPAQYVAIGAHTQGDNKHSHENITIKNCTANGNGGKNGWQGYFVDLMNCKNVVIENNTVSDYARFVLFDKVTKLYNADDTFNLPNSTNYIGADNVLIQNNIVKSHKGTAKAWGIMCDNDKINKLTVKNNKGLFKDSCTIKGTNNNVTI